MRAVIIHAFSSESAAGNPAGVIHQDGSLSAKEMAAIAIRLHCAESVFIEPSHVCDFRLRFFTRIGKEMDACGHATIAACAFVERDEEVSFETNKGKIVVRSFDGRMSINYGVPTFLDYDVSRDDIVVPFGDIVLDAPIELISVGTPKLMVPLLSRQALSSLSFSRDVLQRMHDICERSQIRGFYFFVQGEDGIFYARQINPFGLGFEHPEDPVTGVAGAGLIAYAKKHDLIAENQDSIEIVQPGGKMFVNMADDEVFVGGCARIGNHFEL